MNVRLFKISYSSSSTHITLNGFNNLNRKIRNIGIMKLSRYKYCTINEINNNIHNKILNTGRNKAINSKNVDKLNKDVNDEKNIKYVNIIILDEESFNKSIDQIKSKLSENQINNPTDINLKQSHNEINTKHTEDIIYKEEEIRLSLNQLDDLINKKVLKISKELNLTDKEKVAIEGFKKKQELIERENRITNSAINYRNEKFLKESKIIESVLYNVSIFCFGIFGVYMFYKVSCNHNLIDWKKFYLNLSDIEEVIIKDN